MKRTYYFYIMLFLFFLFGFIIVFSLLYYEHKPIKYELFTTKNTDYKYIPNKTIPNNFRKFNINDVLQETIYAIDFIKTDNKLMSSPSDLPTNSNPEMPSPEEYRTPVNTLNTYKYYSDLEPNVDEKLDAIYGNFFDSKYYPDKMAKPLEYKNFKQKWLELVKPHSELFGKINYFADNSIQSVKYNETDLSIFIFEYMSNSASQNQAEKIKLFFYNIIRPIYLHKNLIDYYLANFSKTNSSDEALYIMNTTRELVGKLKSDIFITNPKGIVYLYQEEAQSAEMNTKGFLADTIVLFQCGSIVKNILELFQKLSSEPKYRESILQMDVIKFYSGFPVYLKKKYPDVYTKKEPLIIYLSVNLPTIPK
jgi:hypothetical protein